MQLLKIIFLKKIKHILHHIIFSKTWHLLDIKKKKLETKTG